LALSFFFCIFSSPVSFSFSSQSFLTHVCPVACSALRAKAGCFSPFRLALFFQCFSAGSFFEHTLFLWQKTKQNPTNPPHKHNPTTPPTTPKTPQNPKPQTKKQTTPPPPQPPKNQTPQPPPHPNPTKTPPPPKTQPPKPPNPPKTGCFFWKTPNYLLSDFLSGIPPGAFSVDSPTLTGRAPFAIRSVSPPFTNLPPGSPLRSPPRTSRERFSMRFFRTSYPSFFDETFSPQVLRIPFLSGPFRRPAP